MILGGYRENDFSTQELGAITITAGNVDLLGNRGDIILRPFPKCRSIPIGDIQMDAETIVFQQLGHLVHIVAIQISILACKVHGVSSRTGRQGIVGSIDGMIPLYDLVCLIEIGMVQRFSLVIPGRVHMIVFPIDTHIVPCVAFPFLGCGIHALSKDEKRLDPRPLQQILQRLGIALTNRSSVHKRAVGVVGIVAAFIGDHRSQFVVEIQLPFQFAHAVVHAVKDLRHGGIKGGPGKSYVSFVHGIAGFE